MTSKAPPDGVIAAFLQSKLWATQKKTSVHTLRWLPLTQRGNNQIWRVICSPTEHTKLDWVIKIVRGQNSKSFRETIHNQQLAIQNGLAPDILEFDASKGVLICPFVQGETLQPKQLEDPETLRRALKALHTLHHLDGEFHHKHSYLNSVTQRQKKALTFMGPQTLARLSKLKAIAEATIQMLKTHVVPACPCHSDMVTHNAILTPNDHIVFIDWEVSGMGDPHEEVANFLWSASLSVEELDRAITQYLGAKDEIARARIILYLMLIPYDWVMRHQIKAQSAKMPQSKLAGLQKRQRKRLKEAVQFANTDMFKRAVNFLQSVPPPPPSEATCLKQ